MAEPQKLTDRPAEANVVPDFLLPSVNNSTGYTRKLTFTQLLEWVRVNLFFLPENNIWKGNAEGEAEAVDFETALASSDAVSGKQAAALAEEHIWIGDSGGVPAQFPKSSIVTPVQIPFNSGSISFDSFSQYSETVTQSGVINISASSKLFGYGATYFVTIHSNGNSINFTDDFLIVRDDREGIAATFDLMFWQGTEGKIRVSLIKVTIECVIPSVQASVSWANIAAGVTVSGDSISRNVGTVGTWSTYKATTGTQAQMCNAVVFMNDDIGLPSQLFQKIAGFTASPNISGYTNILFGAYPNDNAMYAYDNGSINLIAGVTVNQGNYFRIRIKRNSVVLERSTDGGVNYTTIYTYSQAPAPPYYFAVDFNEAGGRISNVKLYT